MSNQEPPNDPSAPPAPQPDPGAQHEQAPFGAAIERDTFAAREDAEGARAERHPLAPDPVTPSVEAPGAGATPPPHVHPDPVRDVPAHNVIEDLASSPLFAESEPLAPPPSHAAPPPVAAAEAPPPPRPVVHEVKAVRVSRFEAPAPTIDVHAERAAPAPQPTPPPASAPRAAEPIAAAAASGAGEGATPPAGGAASATSTAPKDGSGRFWSAACHLMMIPATLTVFLGGLITFFLWQIAGRDDPLANDQGREALNFQINVAVLTALLALSCIGWPLLAVLVPASWIVSIIAAIRAANGERYRYPMIVRVVSR